MTHLRKLYSSLFFLAALIATPAAFADYPRAGLMNLQTPAATSAERIHSFHDFMIWIIAGISLFVLLLLVWVVIRYNRRMNPTPSSVSHNVLIEIVWTVVPVLILIIISIQSLPLIYYTDRTSTPDMTLKVTGYQWYWGYEYPDNGDISFFANMVPDTEINKEIGQKRTLSTDNIVVLPVGKNISIQTTAADVLHAWAIPAFGVKKDSVPGRLNETWVHITKPGIYYGQCSELCGKNHAFMPIEVHAVSPGQFEEWAAIAAANIDEANAFVRGLDLSGSTTTAAAEPRQTTE